MRYFFTIMDSINPYFTSNLKLYGQKKWSNINTDILTNDDKQIFEAMIKNGFIVYDKYEKTYINMNKECFKTEKIDSNFKLQKGDVIARVGHIQIYLGNGMNDVANDFGWGKVQYTFPTKNIYNIVYDEKGYYYTIERENNFKSKN